MASRRKDYSRPILDTFARPDMNHPSGGSGFPAPVRHTSVDLTDARNALGFDCSGEARGSPCDRKRGRRSLLPGHDRASEFERALARQSPDLERVEA
jgi:hypothetical protein